MRLLETPGDQSGGQSATFEVLTYFGEPEKSGLERWQRLVRALLTAPARSLSRVPKGIFFVAWKTRRGPLGAVRVDRYVFAPEASAVIRAAALSVKALLLSRLKPPDRVPRRAGPRNRLKVAP